MPDIWAGGVSLETRSSRTRDDSIRVRVPLAIQHRPGRRPVVTPVQMGGEAAVPTRADPALVKALARVLRHQRLLDEGRYGSISEMAAAEQIERGYLGTLLRPTLLAPALVEQLMERGAGSSPSLPALLQPFPAIWKHQQDCFRSVTLERWSALRRAMAVEGVAGRRRALPTTAPSLRTRQEHAMRRASQQELKPWVLGGRHGCVRLTPRSSG